MSGAASGVRPDQRATAAHPCPICGGHDGTRRGTETRCYGFTSDDGRWAHCTREEHAGGLEKNPKTDAYAHKLDGDCRCGVRHDPSPAAVVNIRGRSGRSKALETPARASGRLVRAYEVKSVDGALVALHERYEDDEGEKWFKWRRRPRGPASLEGLPVADVPLYGSELVADWPEDAVLVLVEGEKAAEALRGAGIRALGTVCGAASTHGQKALEVLRDRNVILWPDNDEKGRAHMERHGVRLAAIAKEIRWFEWEEAPHKGDAADHPTVTTRASEGLAGLRAELAEAPSWEPPRDPPAVAVGGEGPHRFNLTDMGNAERFVARHGQDVRYCFPWEKWLVWTGAKWERDGTGRAHRLAKETVRSIYAEAASAEDEDRRKALAKHATNSEAKGKIEAMLELAKSDVPVSPDELDAENWLINVPNGTVDLRVGELRPHRREDLLTKMAGAEYHPDAAAPEWEAFLERVLPGEELRDFVHRGAGYSATGDTSEQCMFINHGAGANGKSTFQEALQDALGDYATRTPTDMLLAKRAGGVPNDVARLKGSRFVAASETEEGRRLAESLVKDLTGQDTISARFMRAEWFDFKPTHKLWLSTNHKPEIRGTDNAIWRRIRLVPWSVTIPPAEQDRKLAGRLREELPGVLAWVVRGCLRWRRGGLRAPDEVRQATISYRAEMDILAAFVGDECVVSEAASAPASALYGRYKEWCAETGERHESQRKFGERLKERGYDRQRISSGPHKGKFQYLGIGLLEQGPKLTMGGEPLGGKNGNGEPSRTETFTQRNSRKSSENTTDKEVYGEWSEPKNDISALEIESREAMQEKGSLHSLRSPALEASLTEIQDEGTHVLDCQCEDCEFGEV